MRKIKNDSMIFSIYKNFGDLANLFKASIKFSWKISAYKCYFFSDCITDIGVTFMLKEGKPSYTPMTEKYDAMIKIGLPTSMKGCGLFCWMVNFQSSFLKDFRKMSHNNVEKSRKRGVSLNGQKNVKRLLIISNNYWLHHWSYACQQQTLSWDKKGIQAKSRNAAGEALFGSGKVNWYAGYY